MIDTSSIVVVALKCIAMDKSDLSILIDCNSPAALSAHAVLILSIHNSLAEVALVYIKVRAIK